MADGFHSELYVSVSEIAPPAIDYLRDITSIYGSLMGAL